MASALPQFVKVPRGVAPSVLFDLLLAEWRLPAPNLVVSLVGVERPFPMRSWLRDVLRKGLVKAAQSTGQAPAWSRARSAEPGPLPPPPAHPGGFQPWEQPLGMWPSGRGPPGPESGPPRRVPATLRAEARPVHSQGPAASARCPGGADCLSAPPPPLGAPPSRPVTGSA